MLTCYYLVDSPGCYWDHYRQLLLLVAAMVWFEEAVPLLQVWELFPVEWWSLQRVWLEEVLSLLRIW